jgi:hypothetical protein
VLEREITCKFKNRQNPPSFTNAAERLCGHSAIRFSAGPASRSTLLSPRPRASLFSARQYHLVLIDVEGETGIHEAESLCSEIRTAHPGQLVAFVCNWRVAILTDCPDEIIRTEFDPAAFAEGAKDIVKTEGLPEQDDQKNKSIIRTLECLRYPCWP